MSENVFNEWEEFKGASRQLIRIDGYVALEPEEFEMIVGKIDYSKTVEEENERLITKLADIRNLFDESDMEAEGHGMEDMISDPYAVACYAESKMIRLMDKVKVQEKALRYYADRGFQKASEALE